jgi:hypothetical protein
LNSTHPRLRFQVSASIWQVLSHMPDVIREVVQNYRYVPEVLLPAQRGDKSNDSHALHYTHARDPDFGSAITYDKVRGRRRAHCTCVGCRTHPNVTLCTRQRDLPSRSTKLYAHVSFQEHRSLSTVRRVHQGMHAACTYALTCAHRLRARPACSTGVHVR